MSLSTASAHSLNSSRDSDCTTSPFTPTHFDVVIRSPSLRPQLFRWLSTQQRPFYSRESTYNVHGIILCTQVRADLASSVQLKSTERAMGTWGVGFVYLKDRSTLEASRINLAHTLFRQELSYTFLSSAPNLLRRKSTMLQVKGLSFKLTTMNVAEHCSWKSFLSHGAPVCYVKQVSALRPALWGTPLAVISTCMSHRGASCCCAFCGQCH